MVGDPGVTARLIAGRAFGLTNPVRTQSPLFYVHAELQPGGRIGIPSEYPERAAYVVTGRGRRMAKSTAQGRCWSSPDARIRS